MSKPFKLILTWLLCGTMIFCLSVGMLKSLITEYGWVPSHQDAFYHARRILDTGDAPWQFYQFDPLIHMPEGSMLPWPWGFDGFFGICLYLIKFLLPNTEGMKIIAFFAPVWAYLNLALVLGIANTLRFRSYSILLVGLSFASIPRVIGLHGAGDLDHHFMELTFTLGVLWLGLRLFDKPSRSKARVFGWVLGMASAFQTGLFILQLPRLSQFFCCLDQEKNQRLIDPHPLHSFALLDFIIFTTVNIF